MKLNAFAVALAVVSSSAFAAVRRVQPRPSRAPAVFRTARVVGRRTADAPPNFSKPGALIRTAGLLPAYAPAAPAPTFAAGPSAFIGLDDAWSRPAWAAQGLTWAPAAGRQPIVLKAGSVAGAAASAPTSDGRIP